MPIDHSLTYKKLRFNTLPHLVRLKKILKLLKKYTDIESKDIADIGCSNGYILNMISDIYSPRSATGYDHNVDNLKIAKDRYQHIQFEYINLNQKIYGNKKFHIVTCFETLEHVGDLNQGISNLINYITHQDGVLLISVPIEIKLWGILKYLIKTKIYKYTLSEISKDPQIYKKYFKSLIKGERISKYRHKKQGWGTHFGFDYRDIDDYLKKNGVNYKAFNNFVTRFYIIREKNDSDNYRSRAAKAAYS